MCGACGRTAIGDELGGVFASKRARWETARLLNEVLSRADHPGRVRVTAGPWLVCTPTGASKVAYTISAVIRLLASLEPIPLQAIRELHEGKQTPVAEALATTVSEGLTDEGWSGVRRRS